MRDELSRNQQKKTGEVYIHPLQEGKKKLVEFTLELLLPFYLNRYSGGIYNRPFSV
jgi:hypothetical protein